MCLDKYFAGIVLLFIVAVGGSAAAQSTAAQIEKLRTEYNQAETRISAFQIDPHPDAREKQLLASSFSDVASRFDRILVSSSLSENELQHSRYWGGWAHYYAGVLGADSLRNTHLSKANDLFLSFLDVVDVDLGQWTPGLLSLEAPGMCLGLYGLTMVEVAQGNDSRASRCFSLIDSPKASADQRSELPTWRLKSVLLANRPQLVARYLRDLVDKRDADPSEVELKACYTVAIQSFREPASFDRALGIAALEGLYKWKKIAHIRKIMTDLELELYQAPPHLCIECGHAIFERARVDSSPSKYQAAVDVLRPPVNRMWGGRLQSNVLVGRYLMAFSLFQLGEYEHAFVEAHIICEAIAKAKKMDGDWKRHADVARLGAQLQIAALLKTIYDGMTVGEKEKIAQPLTTIQQDAELYGNKNVEVAAYRLTQLRQTTATTEELVAWLEKIEESSPLYLDAIYDMTGVRYRDWRKTPPEIRAAKIDLLDAAAAKYWKATERSAQPNRDLQVISQLVESMVEATPPDVARANKRIVAARRVISTYADRLPLQNILDYHQLELKLAEANNDEAAIVEQARWLAEHGAATRYEIYALIILCRRWDLDTLASASTADQNEALSNHQQFYQRLQNDARKSETPLFELENAEYVAWRVAAIHSIKKKHSMAASVLDDLLAAFPDRAIYLRQAGLEHFQSGDFDKAADSWRRLTKTLKPDDQGDQWCEAKYYLLLCLEQTDVPSAREVLTQFNALYAPLPQPEWKRKFEELTARLHSK